MNCFWDRIAPSTSRTRPAYEFLPLSERIRDAEARVEKRWTFIRDQKLAWYQERLDDAVETARHPGLTPDAFWAHLGFDFYRDTFDSIVLDYNAIQPDGLIYPCFRTWLDDHHYSFVFEMQNRYRFNVRRLAQFARSFGVQDFEAHAKSRFIQPWFKKTGFYSYQILSDRFADRLGMTPREVQDTGLAIVACDVASRVLPLAFQTKSSMRIMILARILTFYPITTREESFQAAQATLRNSQLLLRAFRVAGPLIARFLRKSCLANGITAFSDALEMSMMFSVTEENLLRARTELTTRGFPQMSLVEIKAKVGSEIFDYLLTRAAMFRGHTNSLGMKATTSEFRLRMDAQPDTVKDAVFKAVTGKTWSRAAEDFSLVRDAEPELVDEYLQGRFLGTCPEFAACFHLKQCLRVMGREREFDACREPMIEAAALSKRSGWDEFYQIVLQGMLEEGMRRPASPFWAVIKSMLTKKKPRRG
jgi:hypothetical protein